MRKRESASVCLIAGRSGAKALRTAARQLGWNIMQSPMRHEVLNWLRGRQNPCVLVEVSSERDANCDYLELLKASWRRVTALAVDCSGGRAAERSLLLRGADYVVREDASPEELRAMTMHEPLPNAVPA